MSSPRQHPDDPRGARNPAISILKTPCYDSPPEVGTRHFLVVFLLIAFYLKGSVLANCFIYRPNCSLFTPARPSLPAHIMPPFPRIRCFFVKYSSEAFSRVNVRTQDFRWFTPSWWTPEVLPLGVLPTLSLWAPKSLFAPSFIAFGTLFHSLTTLQVWHMKGHANSWPLPQPLSLRFKSQNMSPFERFVLADTWPLCTYTANKNWLPRKNIIYKKPIFRTCLHFSWLRLVYCY